MKRQVGLWIDHRKAVIVTMKNEGEVTREIRSDIEKNSLSSNNPQATAPDDSHELTAEDMQDRKIRDHLGIYYGEIISVICDADSIWIFGPGEAKIELENQLIHGGFGARVVGIETVDKMTDPQIVAKIRDHFLLEKSNNQVTSGILGKKFMR